MGHYSPRNNLELSLFLTDILVAKFIALEYCCFSCYTLFVVFIDNITIFLFTFSKDSCKQKEQQPSKEKLTYADQFPMPS